MVPRQRHLLEIYLNDHWAGEGAAVALAERVAANNSSSAWSERLCRLADEMADDELALEKVRGRVGVRGGRGKRLVARLGERVGRLKLNGRVTTQSPLSPVLEAEAMIAAISGKRQLWASLDQERLYFGDDFDFDFGELMRRADAQLAVMRAFHKDAAASAFGP